MHGASKQWPLRKLLGRFKKSEETATRDWKKWEFQFHIVSEIAETLVMLFGGNVLSLMTPMNNVNK